MGNYKLSAAAESDLKRIWFRGLDEFGEAQADAYYYKLLDCLNAHIVLQRVGH